METLASDSVAPANADNTAPVETANPDGEAAETNGEGTAPSTPEARAPERDKVQERIDKLTREKYDGLRDLDSARYQIERMREQMAQYEREDREEEAKEKSEANKIPTLESCGYDETKYQAAIAAHFSNLATEQAGKVTEEKLKAARDAEKAQEAQTRWKAKETDFAKSKPDYYEKVYDRSLTLTPEMVQASAESEKGPAVLYHLAENRELALTMSRLPPLTQAVEIGRIVERLSKPVAAPAVSQAPPPPPKVDAPATAADKSPEDMIGSTPAAFAKWRRKFSK